jgi:lysophospholipase L1-like esterase
MTKYIFCCFISGFLMINIYAQEDKDISASRETQTPALSSQNKIVLNFDFGSGHIEQGFNQVCEKTSYNEVTGYGILSSKKVISKTTKGKNNLTTDYITSDVPFYFVVDIPEGRYKITLNLGNPEGNSKITVKAESRRLMLEDIKPEKGKTVTKTIVVDVRTPRINSDEEIRRKPREINYINWDNKLTLEFNGTNPTVYSLQIEEANDLPVIFLAGNSTVVDQEYEPWASWGQMFPRFLKPEIVVANYAESGETLKAFRRENRLKKILSTMKSGDYLFMEFAHNDQKPGGNHVDPFTTYQDELRYFINEARNKGAKPVLVTSTNRRKFDEQGKIVNTLEAYPEAMRKLAEVENIPLIDLNAMSKSLYEALGVKDSKKAFVHYPANTYPNQDKALEDNTHFNPYGAYELAKCVVQQIVDKEIDLSGYIVDDFKGFNPHNPDNWEKFFWPESPATDVLKPDGN